MVSKAIPRQQVLREKFSMYRNGWEQKSAHREGSAMLRARKARRERGGGDDITLKGEQLARASR